MAYVYLPRVIRVLRDVPFLWYFQTHSITQAGRVAFVGMLFKSQNMLYTLHSRGLLHSY